MAATGRFATVAQRPGADFRSAGTAARFRLVAVAQFEKFDGRFLLKLTSYAQPSAIRQLWIFWPWRPLGGLMQSNAVTLMVHREIAHTIKSDPLRPSAMRGVLLALLASVLFGRDTPTVSRLASRLGAFTTAGAMHAVATVAGPYRSLPRNSRPG